MRHSGKIVLINQRTSQIGFFLVIEPNYQTDASKAITAYFYASRVVTYLAGLTIVLAVLKANNSPHQEHYWIIVGLFLICIFWPHIAYICTKYSQDLHKSQSQSLMLDSFFGGICLPILHFELLPSAVFITILMINNISAGGLKLMSLGILALLIPALSTSLLLLPSVNFESDFIIVLSCIPLMVIYPMVLAYINFRLSQLMLIQRKKLLQINRRDSLTQVFNRRYWEQRLIEEFNRCQRSNEKACLMMVDVDHFKSINDTYGHLVGDNVLRQFGSLLQKLRSCDIVGRYGGEEFAILLPNSSLEESLLVAERLRQTIEKNHFDNIGKCTVSIGIASLDKRYNDAYNWLDNADQALYQAKKEGRNRVNIWLNREMRSSSRVAV
jgi:diguanylate cyclase